MWNLYEFCAVMVCYAKCRILLFNRQHVLLARRKDLVTLIHLQQNSSSL